MLRGTDSTNCCPMASPMYACAATCVLSSLSALTIIIFSNLVMRSSKSGTLTCSGASRSYHFFHIGSFRSNESRMSEKAAVFCSALTSSQHLSGIHSFGFLRTDLMSNEPPPFRKTLTLSGESCLALMRILLVIMSAKVSLCRSNKPRWM